MKKQGKCERCQAPRVKLFGLTMCHRPEWCRCLRGFRSGTPRNTSHHEWCRTCILEFLQAAPESDSVSIDLDLASLIELLAKG